MNGNNLNLKFVLDMVDRMSAPFRRIRERMIVDIGHIKSNIGFMAFQVQYYFHHMRKAVTEFGERMKNVGKEIKDIGSTWMTRITAPIMGLGAASIYSAGNVERLTMQFRRLTGDAGKAEAIVKRLQGMKAFKMDDASGALKSFLAAGYSVESAFKRMDFLGEIGAGSGNQLSSLADSYINLRKNGRASAEDLNGMAKANIPIVTELAKQLGKSEQQIYRLAAAGHISFAQVKKAMQGMAAEGGRFAGSMKEVESDINGTLGGIKDDILAVLAPLGKELWKTLDIRTRIKGFVSGLRELVDAFIALPEPVKSFVINMTALVAIVGPLLALLGTLINTVGSIAIGLAKLPTIVMGIARGFAFLGEAIVLVSRLLLANPIGLTITAFAMAGYLLVKHWSKVKTFFADLWSGIKEAFSAAIDPIMALVDGMIAGVQRIITGLGRIKDMAVNNPVTRGLSKAFGNDPATASAPATDAGRSDMRVDTGGKLDITINAEGRVVAADMQPNDRRQAFNLNTGSLVGVY